MSKVMENSCAGVATGVVKINDNDLIFYKKVIDPILWNRIVFESIVPWSIADVYRYQQQFGVQITLNLINRTEKQCTFETYGKDHPNA